MIDWDAFKNRRLRGGFTIVQVDITKEPLIDAVGRPAIARTHIIGRQFSISIRPNLSEGELSVTLCHEVLEAMTVASPDPPASVRLFNEGDFERASYEAHKQFGAVSPANLDRMLQSYGF